MEKPKYYGILPAKVRYDERLKPMEKIIYVELTALAHKKGYCHASNLYFATLYNVHKNTVSIWINDLIRCGYITTKCVTNNGKIEERRIYIVDIDEGEFFQENIENKKREGKQEKGAIKEEIVLEKTPAEEEGIKDFEENIAEELFGESKPQELIEEKSVECEKQREIIKKDATPEELEKRREKLLRELFSEKFIEEMERKRLEEREEIEKEITEEKSLENKDKEREELVVEEIENKGEVSFRNDKEDNRIGISTKKFIWNDMMVWVSTKNWGGYQLKEGYPINKKVEDNNTSIILQDKIIQDRIDNIYLQGG